MRTHEIKLSKEFWDVVIAGQKSFEVRNNDRGYQKGDRVVFNEVDKIGIITARTSEPFIIQYVLSGFGLKEGYVAFSIKPEYVKG